MADEKLSDEQIVTLMLWHAANHPLAIALRQLRAELAEARAALTACASQFQFYAGLHAAAGKPEKAATNQSFADLARSALAAGGKP